MTEEQRKVRKFGRIAYRMAVIFLCSQAALGGVKGDMVLEVASIVAFLVGCIGGAMADSE